MLNDADRIFTNIYGWGDAGLKGAKARGDWDKTAAILALGHDEIVERMKASGLRGRGGAGFPTGLKWSFMPKEVKDRPHYLVVNADESEPGTCKDRDIMQFNPHIVIEGMAIAGLATGATRGFVYIRSEYPDAIEVMEEAVTIARAEGVLGDDVLGSGKAFDLDIRVGAGAYVCGEETAML
ncbi:MAG: NADH-quinone oxidoreductase subunit F, partial [Rhodobacteraceae bacterium]|nr:NADH-quinone oxidoreductase subunit F [Paracoccaceae bacterium]